MAAHFMKRSDCDDLPAVNYSALEQVSGIDGAL